MKNTSNRYKGFLFLLLSLFFSCTPSELKPDEFKEFFGDKENGYMQEVSMGTIKLELAYRPSALLALQEVEGGDSISQQSYNEAYTRYNQYYYFNLSLSDNGKEILYSPRNYANYSELLKVLSFRVGEFVSARADDSEISLTDFYFQPTFGMGSSNTILLVFDKKEIGEAKELEVIIKDFGAGTGDHRFIYSIKTLENIPELKLN